MTSRLIILACLLSFNGLSQVSTDSAAFYIRDIYRQTYTELRAYEWLTTLTKDIGPRLSGSEGAARSVAWAKTVMDTFGLDSVWLQPVRVPHWVRGKPEQVYMITHGRSPVTPPLIYSTAPRDDGMYSLHALALGNSPGTGSGWVVGEVIEVLTLDQLRSIPDEEVKGKIVFFNRPMDLGLLSTFSAYGGAVDQRAYGPALAAEKGAVAAAVRSLSTRLDDYPHTGVTLLSDKVKNIPSVAISTRDADRLSKAISQGPTRLFVQTFCEMLGEADSYNIIGEIRGTVHPDTIILVGGHLDSWDVGEGAHDDGSGCVHAMEVLYRLKKNNYQPRHTIRCVLFMNEENGLHGGNTYAKEAFARDEYHLAAIESDGGGATPQAFGCSAGEDGILEGHLAHMTSFMSLLEPYDIELKAGGGGADITPLKPRAGVLIGLRPDNARYFDYHHSALDVLEAVHPRELASGSAALTSLVFLIDQYGIGQ